MSRAGSLNAAGEAALKVRPCREPFEVELETYLRVREAKVTRVFAFMVPQLPGSNAEVLVLETTVVQQRFVLDFGEMRLEFPLELPGDVWTHSLVEKPQRFVDRWPVVQRVPGGFEALDISPRARRRGR